MSYTSSIFKLLHFKLHPNASPAAGASARRAGAAVPAGRPAAPGAAVPWSRGRCGCAPGRRGSGRAPGFLAQRFLKGRFGLEEKHLFFKVKVTEHDLGSPR